MLRARQIGVDSRHRLIFIESVDSWCAATGAAMRLFGRIEPVAVVVCTANGSYALDMDANPANLDQLRKSVPELDDTLTA